jgi:membrane protein required for colicin V production
MMNFSDFTNLDYLITVIIIMSVIFGFVRGFVYSLVYFIAWILSFMITVTFHSDVFDYLKRHFSSEALVKFSSTVGFFIISLTLMILLSMQLLLITKKLREGAIDKSIGLLFGFFRGVVIVSLLLLILINTMSSLDAKPKWLYESLGYKYLKEPTKYLAFTLKSYYSDKDMKKILNLDNITNIIDTKNNDDLSFDDEIGQYNNVFAK